MRAGAESQDAESAVRDAHGVRGQQPAVQVAGRWGERLPVKTDSARQAGDRNSRSVPGGLAHDAPNRPPGGAIFPAGTGAGAGVAAAAPAGNGSLAAARPGLSL